MAKNIAPAIKRTNPIKKGGDGFLDRNIIFAIHKAGIQKNSPAHHEMIKIPRIISATKDPNPRKNKSIIEKYDEKNVGTSKRSLVADFGFGCLVHAA